MIKKWIEKYIKPWFFDGGSSDKVKPIRVAITVLLALVIVSIVMKLVNPIWLSDAFIGIMTGQIGILIGADTWRANAKDKNGNDK